MNTKNRIQNLVAESHFRGFDNGAPYHIDMDIAVEDDGQVARQSAQEFGLNLTMDGTNGWPIVYGTVDNISTVARIGLKYVGPDGEFILEKDPRGGTNVTFEEWGPHNGKL